MKSFFSGFVSSAILSTLVVLFALQGIDTYLDGTLPLYSSIKPHGQCNTFKRIAWQSILCHEVPLPLELPKHTSLDTLSTLKNLSKAIVLVDERLRDDSLLLRQSARKLTGDDAETLKLIVEKASLDLGHFRVAFDGVFDTIVSSMEKIRVNLKSLNSSMTRLLEAFDTSDEKTWTYNLNKFEKQLNVIIRYVQPIPDMLSKTRQDASFEQMKLVDLAAETEIQKEKYYLEKIRTKLGFLTTLNSIVTQAESSVETLKHAESRLRNSYSRWKTTRDELKIFFNADVADFFKRLKTFPELKDSYRDELVEFVDHVRGEIDFMDNTGKT